MAAVVEGQLDAHALLKANQAKRTARLKPLFVQCAQLLDSKLLSNEVDVSFKKGIKQLPDEVKEQLISSLSKHQLGRHYQVLLGKFITQLKVDKWPIIDYAAFFQCLADECPHLQNLFVHSLSYYQPTCAPALKNLLQTATITDLRLSELSRGISRECFENILQYGTSLTSLNVSSQQLNDQNLRNLPQCTTLVNLSLVDCFRLSSTSLDTLKQCKNLRSLYLRTNPKWTNAEMIDFCSKENGCTQLQALDLDRVKQFISLRIHLPQLLSLDIDNSLAEIDSFELGCPELRKLSLKLQLTFGETIAKELPALKNLESFKLREDQFNNVDYSEVVRHVGRHKDLRTLKLPCMNGFISPQVLSSFACNVEKLLLMNISEISDESLVAFSKNLPCLKNLTVMGATLISPVFDFPLLEVLDSSLVRSMERVKVKCPNLLVLDISNCNKLETVEWGCPNVVQVYLAGLEKFTNDEICRMTGNCQQLTKVMMSKLPLVTDDVAVALCTLPRLQTLNVSDCPLITSKTMEQLYHMFPNIFFFGECTFKKEPVN